MATENTSPEHDKVVALTDEIKKLQGKAQEALATAEEDRSKLSEMTEFVDKEVKPQIDQLAKDRAVALQELEFKSMQSQITDLHTVIENLKKPSGEFVLPTDENGETQDEPYGEGKALSFFADVRSANKGRSEAIERLTKGFEGLKEDGKALTEGVGAQGGYLVRPSIERQIVENKELDNVLRGLCSKLNINTNALQLDQLALSTVAGWVAELAQKPEETALTLASVTANVFTAAGLVTVSNQLLADSDPAVDQLAIRDLTKRLVALEEAAFISGSGVNQPLGLLNTPGLGTTIFASGDEFDLVNAILDSISDVQENHGEPSAILMHPRTWTWIIKAQNTSGSWLLGGPQDVNPTVTQPRTAFGGGPSRFLWGVPVVLSNRVPTNLGGATNESRIVVGDFTEALILDRQGITVDESPHVYFTTNQTVFRAEERVGFTAARNPTAFSVVGGAGLATH